MNTYTIPEYWKMRRQARRTTHTASQSFKQTIASTILAALLLLPLSASAADFLGTEAGVFYEGIYVTNSHNADDFTYNYYGAPNQVLDCTVNSSDLAEQFSTYGTKPSVVTIAVNRPFEIWAMADCMSFITNYVNNYWPGVKVLIDVQLIFTQEQMDPDDVNAINKRHPYYQERAAEWYARALASGPIFSANQVLGIIVKEEVLAKGLRNGSEVFTDGTQWSNGELTGTIVNGTAKWNDGPNWAAVDTVAGHPVTHLQFPHYNDRFSWALDVAVLYDYNTYNPNNESHALNDDAEFFDWIDTWESHLKKNSGQKVALNVRGAIGFDDFKASTVRWTQLAWCRWAKWQTRFTGDHDLIWSGIWTWRSYPSITGLDELNNTFTGDGDGDGLNDLIEQTEEYWEITQGLDPNCNIE